MWSNNDGMGPTWAPLDNDDFVEYMNGRKIHYLNTHPNHFNTVHVTDWAHEFYRFKEAEKGRLIQEAEALGWEQAKLFLWNHPHTKVSPAYEDAARELDIEISRRLEKRERERVKG